jgi:hypothetical protein
VAWPLAISASFVVNSRSPFGVQVEMQSLSCVAPRRTQSVVIVDKVAKQEIWI